MTRTINLEVALRHPTFWQEAHDRKMELLGDPSFTGDAGFQALMDMRDKYHDRYKKRPGRPIGWRKAR